MSRPLATVGLVGAGGIGRVHAPALLALGYGVLVLSRTGASQLTAQYGIRSVDSYESLLKQVDVVDIVTPTDTHFSLIQEALLAGCDVISEKPLTRSLGEADELRRLASSLGRTIYPAHVVRYFPEYVRLKEAVEAGLLGDLAVLRFSRTTAGPARAGWFGDATRSGGIVMDQAIHDIDVARWVAGEVTTVSAALSVAGDGPTLCEATHITLTHRTGAITQVSGFWGPSHLKFTTEYSVTGTLANLVHSSYEQASYRADVEAKMTDEAYLPPPDPASDPFAAQLGELLGAHTYGTTTRVTFEDGYEALRIVEAALESVQTGQPVALREGAQ